MFIPSSEEQAEEMHPRIRRSRSTLLNCDAGSILVMSLSGKTDCHNKQYADQTRSHAQFKPCCKRGLQSKKIIANNALPSPSDTTVFNKRCENIA